MRIYFLFILFLISIDGNCQKCYLGKGYEGKYCDSIEYMYNGITYKCHIVESDSNLNKNNIKYAITGGKILNNFGKNITIIIDENSKNLILTVYFFDKFENLTYSESYSIPVYPPKLDFRLKHYNNDYNRFYALDASLDYDCDWILTKVKINDFELLLIRNNIVVKRWKIKSNLDKQNIDEISSYVRFKDKLQLGFTNILIENKNISEVNNLNLMTFQ